MTNPYAGGQPDFTAIADPDVRARFALGHHPRRTGTAVIARPEPIGWYRTNDKDFYRASEALLYRVDVIDGHFQVVRMDLRPDSDTHGVNDFGPQLRTWVGARALVEGDAAEQLRQKPVTVDTVVDDLRAALDRALSEGVSGG